MTNPTAEERADRLLERIWKKPGFGEDLWAEYRDILAEQIKQASQEAYERGVQEALGTTVIPLSVSDRNCAEAYVRGKLDGLKDGDSCTSKSMEIARDEALEEAARVAEEFEDVNTQDYYGEEIALSIRALKEVKR